MNHAMTDGVDYGTLRRSGQRLGEHGHRTAMIRRLAGEHGRIG
jgi:hypothetical protein